MPTGTPVSGTASPPNPRRVTAVTLLNKLPNFSTAKMIYSDWQVSATSDFSDIVFQSLSDSSNLLSITVDTSTYPSLLFFRVRHAYEDGEITDWSEPQVCYNGIWCAFGYGDFYLLVPGGPDSLALSTTIYTSAYTTPVGSTVTVTSTNWTVTEVNTGVVVDQSLADPVNLESYTIPPSVLQPGVLYSFTASYNLSDSTVTDDVVVAAQVPTIDAPTIYVDNEVVVGPNTYTNLDPLLRTEVMSVPDGADTHTLTDWRVYEDATNTLMFEELNSASRRSKQYSIGGGTPLQQGTTYRVEARHHGRTGVISPWGTYLFTTGPSVVIDPPNIAVVGAPNGVSPITDYNPSNFAYIQGFRATITNPFTVVPLADVLLNIDWWVEDNSGAIIWSNLADTSAPVDIYSEDTGRPFDIPAGILQQGQSYTIFAIYRGILDESLPGSTTFTVPAIDVPNFSYIYDIDNHIPDVADGVVFHVTDMSTGPLVTTVGTVNLLEADFSITESDGDVSIPVTTVVSLDALTASISNPAGLGDIYPDTEYTAKVVYKTDVYGITATYEERIRIPQPLAPRIMYAGDPSKAGIPATFTFSGFEFLTGTEPCVFSRTIIKLIDTKHNVVEASVSHSTETTVFTTPVALLPGTPFRLEVQHYALGEIEGRKGVYDFITLDIPDDPPVLVTPDCGWDVVWLEPVFEIEPVSALGPYIVHQSTVWSIDSFNSATGLWSNIFSLTILAPDLVLDSIGLLALAQSSKYRVNVYIKYLTGGTISYSQVTTHEFTTIGLQYKPTIEGYELIKTDLTNGLGPHDRIALNFNLSFYAEPVLKHVSTYWIVYREDVLNSGNYDNIIFNDPADTVNLHTPNFPYGLLAQGYRYRIGVRYNYLRNDGGTCHTDWSFVDYAPVSLNTPVISITGYPDLISRNYTISVGQFSTFIGTANVDHVEFELTNDTTGAVVTTSIPGNNSTLTFPWQPLEGTYGDNLHVRARYVTDLGVASSWATLAFTIAEETIVTSTFTVTGEPTSVPVDPTVDITSVNLNNPTAPDVHVDTRVEIVAPNGFVLQSYLASATGAGDILHIPLTGVPNICFAQGQSGRIDVRVSIITLLVDVPTTRTLYRATIEQPLVGFASDGSTGTEIEPGYYADTSSNINSQVVGGVYAVPGATDVVARWLGTSDCAYVGPVVEPAGTETHQSTSWIVTRISDGLVVFSSLLDNANLETITLSGISPNTSYTVRVIFHGVYGDSTPTDVTITTGNALSVTPPILTTTELDITATSLTPHFDMSAFLSDPAGLGVFDHARWNIREDSTQLGVYAVDTFADPGSMTVPAGTLSLNTVYDIVAFYYDSLGNFAGSNQIVFTTIASLPIVVTFQDAPLITNTPLIITAPFSISGTHASTDWILYNDTTNAVLWQSLNDVVNLTSVTIPTGFVPPNITVRIEARHRNNSGVVTPYGSDVGNTGTWLKYFPPVITYRNKHYAAAPVIPTNSVDGQTITVADPPIARYGANDAPNLVLRRKIYKLTTLRQTTDLNYTDATSNNNFQFTSTFGTWGVSPPGTIEYEWRDLTGAAVGDTLTDNVIPVYQSVTGAVLNYVPNSTNFVITLTGHDTSASMGAVDPVVRHVQLQVRDQFGVLVVTHISSDGTGNLTLDGIVPVDGVTTLADGDPMVIAYNYGDLQEGTDYTITAIVNTRVGNTIISAAVNTTTPQLNPSAPALLVLDSAPPSAGTAADPIMVTQRPTISTNPYNDPTVGSPHASTDIEIYSVTNPGTGTEVRTFVSNIPAAEQFSLTKAAWPTVTQHGGGVRITGNTDWVIRARHVAADGRQSPWTEKYLKTTNIDQWSTGAVPLITGQNLNGVRRTETAQTAVPTLQSYIDGGGNPAFGYVNRFMVAYGGTLGAFGATGTFLVYDFLNDTLRDSPINVRNLRNTAITEGGLAGNTGTFWLVGGEGNTRNRYQTRTYEVTFDTVNSNGANDSSVRLANCPRSVGYHTLTAWPRYTPSKLILIGGRRRRDASPLGYRSRSNVQIYDIATNSWSLATNAPRVLDGHGALLVGDAIYVMGGSGVDNSDVYTTNYNVYKYDIPTDTWTDMGALFKDGVNPPNATELTLVGCFGTDYYAYIRTGRGLTVFTPEFVHKSGVTNVLATELSSTQPVGDPQLRQMSLVEKILPDGTLVQQGVQFGGSTTNDLNNLSSNITRYNLVSI